MKLTNAGLLSCSDAMRLLQQGEVFYTNKEGCKVFYDRSYCADGHTPFRMGEQPLMATWADIASWQKEVPEPKWKPCLCWVDNRDVAKRQRVSLIEADNDKNPMGFQFKSASKTLWKYATPITREEAEQYINE